MNNKFSRYSLIIAFLLVLQACQSEPDQTPSGLDSSGISTATEQVTVNGVSSKGPIAGASIEIIQFNASDGAETSTVLATTTTDSSGNWSVNIPAASHTVPLLIKSSGGEFLDESDTNPDASLKRKITLASNEYLLGVLFPGHNTASVTMLTHAFIQKSRIESSVSGNFLNVLSNNRSIASSGLGFDPFTVAAANPLSPSVSASVDSIEYAMYLGGLATALNSSAIKLGIPVPTYSVIAGMVADLSDGDLDGANQNGVVMLDVGNGSVAFPSDNNLNNAITRFRNNNYAAYSVTPVSQVITINESALTVSGVNNDPVAFDDSYTTVANASIVTGNVLSNDTDPDGDALAVSSVIQPANGVVVNNGNGTFNFTPTSGFTGNAVFSYSISDGHGGSDTAQVVIAVTAAPGPVTTTSPPVAQAGADQIVNEGATVTLTGSGTDSDGTISAYQWSQIGSSNMVNLTNSSSANANFTAPGVSAGQSINLFFELQVTDNDGLSDTDIISIQVNSSQTSNSPPTANAGADQSVNEQTNVVLDATGSSDTDGSINAYLWTQVNGTEVTLNAASTPTPNFTSPEVLVGNIEILLFQLIVTDNVGDTSSDFVSVLVNPVAIPPTANAGADQNQNELTQVFLNGTASTDDRSVVSFSWVQTAGTPTVALTGANTDSPSFTAPDIANDTLFTFQLTVTDDEGGSSTDSVDINVLSLNAGPTVADDSGFVATEDTPLSITTLLDNDSDPEGDAITISSVTQPANGAVVIDAGNTSVTYTPNTNFNGSDSFTYTAVDANGAFSSGSATVALSVSGVNDNPVAVNDSASVTQGFSIVLGNLTANDTDPEGDTLSITAVSQGGNGTVVNNFNGTITYTPDLAFNGTDSFTYTIADNNGGSASAIVSMTIIADSDGDGLTDSDEISIHGTNPNMADSDSDGFYDQHELLIGTNPNDSLDVITNVTEISVAMSNNNIVGTDTWTLAGSPYWVRDDVTVQAGATLTIEAGVVVKFDPNVDVFVNSTGSLQVLGNAPVPQNVRFTSILDDSLNGDTGGVTGTPGANNWPGIDFRDGSTGQISNASIRYAYTCLYIEDSSPVITNLEVGDCAGYGVETYAASNSMSTILHGVKSADFDANSSSTSFSGIYIHSTNAVTNTLEITDIAMDRTNGAGIWMTASGSSNISGTVDRISVSNTGQYGIYMENTGTGNINPVFSDISIANPGSNYEGLYLYAYGSGTMIPQFGGTGNSISGVASNAAAIYVRDLTGTSTVAPVFLASSSWTINGGEHGLQLDNAGGEYNQLSINGSSIGGILLMNNSAPTVFDTVTLTNLPTPYSLDGMALPATVQAGTIYGSGVPTNYIRFYGTVNSTHVFGPDPLGTGNSVWRLSGTVIVNAGGVMQVDPGAVLKFDNFALNVQTGGSLNIAGTSGNPAYLTSILDDGLEVGGDTNGDGSVTLAAPGNWAYINVANGASISIDNAIIRYAGRAIYSGGGAPTAFSISNSSITNFQYSGLEINTNSGTPTFSLSNLSISETNAANDGIYLAASGGSTILNMDNVTIDQIGNNATFDHGLDVVVSAAANLTGTWNNLSVSNIASDGVNITETTSGNVTPTISGLSVSSPGRYGVSLTGDTLAPIFNSSVGTNTITGGTYNLFLNQASGSYANLALDGASLGAISAMLPNPTAWDDASIVMTNAPTPYRLFSNIPAVMGTLGTATPGYTVGGAGNLGERYIRIDSDFAIEDLTLTADPLGTGSSVWYAANTVTIPTGRQMTIPASSILKLELGARLDVTGSLVVSGTAGNEAYLTSILDDSVGGDSNNDGASTGSSDDWGYINVYSNANISIDQAIIRFMGYGVNLANYAITGFSISNTSISNFRYYALSLSSVGTTTFNLNSVSIQNGTTRDAIYIYCDSSDAVTLNFDGVSISNVGDTADDNGLEIVLRTASTVTGTVYNLSIDNQFGNGVYIDDQSSGIIDVEFSALNIVNTGGDGFHVDGDTSTAPVINAASGANFIGDSLVAGSGGTYGLAINGAAGSYSNLTIEQPGIASLYFENGANPTFDGASVVLGNALTPYNLVGMALPPSVAYTAGTGLSENYIRIHGSLSADTNLVMEPLGVGTFWYVPSVLYVTSGNTLSVDAGTVVKIAASTYLDIQAGGTLDVNGTSTDHVVFTSSTDNNVGVANPALTDDWFGVYFRAGSLAGGQTIDFLDVWYPRYGIDINNVDSGLTFNNLTVNYAQRGLTVASSTTSNPTFNNLIINESTIHQISLSGNGNMDTTFTGTLELNDIEPTANASSGGFYITSTDPSLVISNFTVSGSQYPLYLAGSAAPTIENNILRNGVNYGIFHFSSGNPIIRDNTIVNNGNSGIYMSGANGTIFGNLIRNHTATTGSGIYMSSSSPIVENNLIVNNHSTRNSSNGGGAGIFISGTSSPTIINNTVAHNTSADTNHDLGSGISIETTGGTVTLRDNILFGNTDASESNDLWVESTSTVVSSNNLIGALASDAGNSFIPDATDNVGGDPQFTNADRWYTNTAVAVVDQGSSDASTIIPFALNNYTTRTDGGLDDGSVGGDSAIVNLGFHYDSAAATVSAADSLVVPISALNLTTSAAAQIVTITVTPRDNIQNILGAGQIVTASAINNPTWISGVKDLGDGDYQFTFTIPMSDNGGGTSGNGISPETINVSVNGTQLDQTVAVSWTLN